MFLLHPTHLLYQWDSFVIFSVWLFHLFHCYLGIVANVFSLFGFAVADVLHYVINRAFLFLITHQPKSHMNSIVKVGLTGS